MPGVELITKGLAKKMANMAEISSAKVLEFWFSDANEQNWFFGGAAFDEEIKRLFAETRAGAESGLLDHWAVTVEGRLALIIVLDQFSRHIYRHQAAAFDTDAKALEIARRALRLGDDLWMKVHRPANWRTFIYLPFMHSEDLGDQRQCIDLLLTHGPEESVAYARAHHDVIARFGRFPHRNDALGRATNKDEANFLSHAGSDFAT